MKKQSMNKYLIPGLAVLVFLVMFFFFYSAHPLVVFDSDDWYYMDYTRHAFLEWGERNPIKVFAEVLMSLCTTIAAFVIKPFMGDFIDSVTLMNALVVSAMITLYVVMFVLLLKKKNSCTEGEAVLSGILFLIFHFVIFRTDMLDNEHMFWTMNVTCYYHYLIPDMLNCIFVMVMMSGDSVQSFWKPEKYLQKGIFLVLLYMALESNLFSNVIIAAYIGTELLVKLFDLICAKKFKLLNYMRENAFYLLVIVWWLVIQIFELNGQRADQIGADGNFFVNVNQAVHIMYAELRNMNGIFMKFVFVVVLLAIILMIYNHKLGLDKNFMKKIIPVCIACVLTAVYIILVCGKAGAGYVARKDVLFGIVFYFFIIVMMCIWYICNYFNRVKVLLPLITVILFFEIQTTLGTFKESNVLNINPEICVAIDKDIINQCQKAEAKGEDGLILYVPDFHTDDNWPAATYANAFIGGVTHKYGLTHKLMNILQIVPDNSKNKEFGIK